MPARHGRGQAVPRGGPMTEAEWMACTEPRAMLGELFARGQSGSRKPRLFACACAASLRRFALYEWDTPECEVESYFSLVRRVVDVAESLADGRVTPED